MLMRHIRYFIAVAEELSFTRAAERLHIEQSPLSRSIRQLEDDLGVRLFERNSHGTRLTWAGQVFLEEARRVLAAVEQARAGARAAATGYRGLLRIALSDGISPSHLSNLLARCREESPEVEISLFEVTLAQQLKGLREGDYDAGFAKAEHPGEGLLATPAWSEPLVVAVPARHPALIHPELSLMELLSHPLVLCDPNACAGCKVARAISAPKPSLLRITSHGSVLPKSSPKTTNECPPYASRRSAALTIAWVLPIPAGPTNSRECVVAAPTS
ncbi:LysR family transcriptional regulator [Proteus mirabilis]